MPTRNHHGVFIRLYKLAFSVIRFTLSSRRITRLWSEIHFSDNIKPRLEAYSFSTTNRNKKYQEDLIQKLNFRPSTSYILSNTNAHAVYHCT